MLNSLINSSTDSGSIYNVLNEDVTKERARVNTGRSMLGELHLYAGNIDLHGLNPMNRNIQFHFTTLWNGFCRRGFLAADWCNLSHHLLSTAVSAGSISNQLKGSIDVYISTQGGDGNNKSPFINDFTFTIGVSGLQMLLQVVPKIDLGNINHLQLRHLAQLDCWISALAEVIFHQVRAKIKGSLSASVNCRKFTSPGIFDLQKTLSTEQASEDLTNLFNKMLLFVSNIIESESVHTEINGGSLAQIFDAQLHQMDIIEQGYENIDTLKNNEKEDAEPLVVDAKSDQ